MSLSTADPLTRARFRHAACFRDFGFVLSPLNALFRPLVIPLHRVAMADLKGLLYNHIYTILSSETPEDIRNNNERNLHYIHSLWSLVIPNLQSFIAKVNNIVRAVEVCVDGKLEERDIHLIALAAVQDIDRDIASHPQNAACDRIDYERCEPG